VVKGRAWVEIISSNKKKTNEGGERDLKEEQTQEKGELKCFVLTGGSSGQGFHNAGVRKEGKI